jgi:hypothetical protein
VGALFVSAFFLYGGGVFLVFLAVGDDAALPANADSLAELCAGSALLLLNSAAVITIGVLALRVLRREYRATAHLYLGARIAEAALLALAPLGTLVLALSGSGQPGFARTLAENAATTFSVAMATLGVGSIFFCWVLLKSGLLPRILAAYGIAGYAIFALGSVLELSGYSVELIMSLPGGLFEIAAGFYLLAKGVRSPALGESVPPHDTHLAALQISPAAASSVPSAPPSSSR